MITIAEELEIYRDRHPNTLYTDALGVTCSKDLDQIVRRQLRALLPRYLEKSINYQYITRMLDSDFNRDDTPILADCMLFVFNEVNTWLRTYLGGGKFTQIPKLITLVVKEFNFACEFDACVVLHALSAVGNLKDRFPPISAN
jgi:hypothetical protein